MGCAKNKQVPATTGLAEKRATIMDEVFECMTTDLTTKQKTAIARALDALADEPAAEREAFRKEVMLQVGLLS